MSRVVKRIGVELNKLKNNPIPGVSVSTVGDAVDQWVVKFDGPVGTPFEGGILTLNVQFPEGYPHKAPVVKFNPPAYHPNVANDGIPCLETTTSKFSPSLPMSEILKEIVEVIKTPNPSHANDTEAGKLFVTNPEEYKKKAAEWTKKYAH